MNNLKALKKAELIEHAEELQKSNLNLVLALDGARREKLVYFDLLERAIKDKSRYKEEIRLLRRIIDGKNGAKPSKKRRQKRRRRLRIVGG